MVSPGSLFRGGKQGINCLLEVGRFPFVALRADFQPGQVARGIDDGRAEVVGDLGFAGLVKEPQRHADLGQLGMRGNRVRPERRRGPANLRMLAQDSGVSCSGSNESEIKPDLPGTVRESTDPLGQLGEFLVHERAKIGQRTSRINKREYDHIAAQVGELDACHPGWSW